MTVDQLIACGVAPTAARVFAEPLAAALARFDITTAKRRAAFVAQAMHESARFTGLEENLRYSDPARIAKIFRSGFDLDRDRVVDPEEIEFAKQYVRNPKALANRAYANRGGNGGEASGDGWRYRGRGIFQLTGRDNYRDAGLALEFPYLDQPDLVAQPMHAALTAGWFWDCARLNRLADAGDIDGITRAINGPAMLGRHERAELYQEALDALA